MCGLPMGTTGCHGQSLPLWHTRQDFKGVTAQVQHSLEELLCGLTQSGRRKGERHACSYLLRAEAAGRFTAGIEVQLGAVPKLWGVGWGGASKASFARHCYGLCQSCTRSPTSRSLPGGLVGSLMIGLSSKHSKLH